MGGAWLRRGRWPLLCWRSAAVLAEDEALPCGFRSGNESMSSRRPGPHEMRSILGPFGPTHLLLLCS